MKMVFMAKMYTGSTKMDGGSSSSSSSTALPAGKTWMGFSQIGFPHEFLHDMSSLPLSSENTAKIVEN